MKKPTLLFSLISLSILVVGCGKAGGTASVENASSKEAKGTSASTETPDNLNLATARDKSFTMELPEGWLVCDAEDANYKAEIKKLKADDSPLVMNVESIASSTTANFGAIDISASTMDDNFAANINANVQNMGSSNISEAELKEAVNAISQMLFKDQAESVEIIEFNGRKSGKYSGIADMGQAKVHLTGYSVPVGDKVYTFTFSCGSEESAKYKPIFDKMAKSIKIN